MARLLAPVLGMDATELGAKLSISGQYVVLKKDVTPAVKRADEIGFDQIQMIQDDKNRWALYLKPEHQNGYSIYPDKEDVNRFSPRSNRRWTTSTRYAWNWRTSIMYWRKHSQT